jgi:hypothetical protein
MTGCQSHPACIRQTHLPATALLLWPSVLGYLTRCASLASGLLLSEVSHGAETNMEKESAREVCMGQSSMNQRIETSEARVFRHARHREILCRLTYEVTPFREGLFRWFLLGIEELE